MDNPNGHINWYAVLETKRLLLRPNTNATWITTHQIETYSTPYMYTLFATSTEHIDRYASTCAHSHTMRARTMRAYANARIRIALHANAFLMRHASIRVRYLGVFRVRYARICAHSHAMRAHSHRMRSHSHRMRSHRMRMRAFKGNLCVSGTVETSASLVYLKISLLLIILWTALLSFIMRFVYRFIRRKVCFIQSVAIGDHHKTWHYISGI